MDILHVLSWFYFTSKMCYSPTQTSPFWSSIHGKEKITEETENYIYSRPTNSNYANFSCEDFWLISLAVFFYQISMCTLKRVCVCVLAHVWHHHGSRDGSDLQQGNEERQTHGQTDTQKAGIRWTGISGGETSVWKASSDSEFSDPRRC